MESFVDYDLDIDRAVLEIGKAGAKRVCLQLPDGLRPMGGVIADKISSATDAVVFLWLGSCYGACDIPFDVERLGVDMLIQWGHSVWAY